MPPAAFPTHPTSARLAFRPVTADDVDLLHPWQSDARAYTHAPQARHTSREQTAHFVERWAIGWCDGGPSYWVVSRRDTGEAIGVGGLRSADSGLNLYYRLAFEQHGNGFGTEIARVSTSLAMEFADSDAVFAMIRPVNKASIRTAEKAGMTKSATFQPEESGLPAGEAPSEFFQLPLFTTDSPSPEEEQRLRELWTAVNADAEVAVLNEHLAAGDTLGRLINRETNALEAAAFLTVSPDSRLRHIGSLQPVMTDPHLRGLNKERLLVAGLRRTARERGIELRLPDGSQALESAR